MTITEAKLALPFPALLNRLGVSAPDREKFSMQCPLHNEQHGRSFSVDRKNGNWWWYCFGKCSLGGDEITFLEVYKSIPRAEAIRLYLELAGNGTMFKTTP